MLNQNEKLRLKEAAKGSGKSLRLMEEVRKLYRLDASSIAEVRAVSNVPVELMKNL